MVYRYKVKWYFDDKEIISEGIGFAKNFPDAMECISHEFGEDEIMGVSVEFLQDGDMINFDDLKETLEETEPEHSTLGPQVIAALADLIDSKEVVE